MPILRRVAQTVYDEISPVQPDDADHGYALENLVAALAKPLDDLDDILGDQYGMNGWGLAWNPVTAPAAWLPWLAQIVGAQLVAGETEDQSRDRVIAAAGQRRGTRDAMVAAAQRSLTGARFVRVVERDGSPYRVTVITRTSETPDPAAVVRDITARDVKPAGLIVTHLVAAGQTWNEVPSATTWDGVPAGVRWDDTTMTTIA